MPRKTIVTCVNTQIERAPRRVRLMGDKARPEPGQHVIEFPGGAVEVSRLDDGSYWCHVIVNRGWALNDTPGLRHRKGKVIASRVGRARTADDPGSIVDLPGDLGEVEQIAVLVMPEPLTRAGQ